MSRVGRPDARWLAGAVALAGAAHAAPGVAAWRSVRVRLAPRLSGVGDAGHVALTFDDGPDPVSTPAICEVLEHLGWQATFFLLGSEVEHAGGLPAELVARGHEVGVHGYRHSSHLRHTLRWVRDDVRRGFDVVAEATGAEPLWFRPPYGALATSSLVTARHLGLRTVLWTTWGRDWRATATPESVTDDVERRRGPGATVLLHDSDITSAAGAWRSARGALPLLAERWSAEGLKVGTLADHGIAR